MAFSPPEPLRRFRFTRYGRISRAFSKLPFMLDISELNFGFSEKPLFKDFSLSIQKNERVALMGRSGIGKTTLFRLITGWLKPESGKVVVKNSLALMSQEETLLPWKTVLKNLLVFTKDRSKALCLLDQVGLSEYAKAFPGDLSKGMRQRVALARALLSKRSLLILDEPFSALDEETKQKILPLIDAYEGAVLMITHDRREAEQLGCRIIDLGLTKAGPSELHCL